MRYKLSENASQQLDDIFFKGLLDFGEVQALKYQDSFSRTFELLAYMPTLGRKSERGGENEHRFPHGSHTIYYRIEDDMIVIEAVVYSPLITDLWGDL